MHGDIDDVMHAISHNRSFHFSESAHNTEMLEWMRLGPGRLDKLVLVCGDQMHTKIMIELRSSGSLGIDSQSLG